MFNNFLFLHENRHVSSDVLCDFMCDIEDVWKMALTRSIRNWAVEAEERSNRAAQTGDLVPSICITLKVDKNVYYDCSSMKQVRQKIHMYT